MADKWQTQQTFWSSFGIPAYDEQTTFTDGDEPSFPHITYQSASGVVGQLLTINASLWYKSTSWVEISRKADEILRYMRTHRTVMRLDNGFFWIRIPETTPFAQRVASGSNNENIKRILLSVEAECLTDD